MISAYHKTRDEHQRRIAIDTAIDYIKNRWPEYFHPTPTIKD